jgi:hypothetical protein
VALSQPAHQRVTQAVGLKPDCLMAEGHMRKLTRLNSMIGSWLDSKKITIKSQLEVVMKKRWLVYTLIGIVFGVFDFYYQIFIHNIFYDQLLSSLGRSLVWPILILGIWLVPIIPIILYEAKFSHSSWLPALASALTWSTSVVAYYLTNSFQLAIVGVPSRPEMHISNRNDPYFWVNWRGVFLDDLVVNNIEWMVVAIIGGTVMGFLLNFIFLRLKAIRQRRLRQFSIQ